MSGPTHFLSRLLQAALKVTLALAAAIFVLSFLLAALFVVLVMSLWSLLTGRKPAPLVLFGRMREQSQRYTQGAWPGRRGPSPARHDIVDVQATEVREPSRPDPRLH